MAGQPGKVGARLDHALVDDAEIRFVSIAEWESGRLLLAQRLFKSGECRPIACSETRSGASSLDPRHLRYPSKFVRAETSEQPWA